ncbi:hypothetical protein AXE65_03715 [Ventosimonas gracilis]|uniref:Uncharacterized protein n=1 Tax=Ventosimonas gracilis TaxID=1680762 RepID=A0A139SS58_9GAMM|nr:L,D-transpeptidase family protein [Ventosimonas gracilis]KXU37310.1 hypothetical protein AXE65_03715 [Ventosimonas gracilis]
MWSRIALSLIALLSARAAFALVFPLPPAGDSLVGEVQTLTVRYEDTFASIADQFDLGFLELVAANPEVDPWLPGEGTQILLPTRYILPSGSREGVVINLAEYRLYYFPKGKNVVYTYPLGIGREGWNSPLGETRITQKTPNPSWYPPESIRREHAEDGDPLPRIVPPGPDNPLGPYKMTLALPGYLIHGSNKFFGIGMRVSHGCFRMLNPNVLELASMVKVGTPVRIIDMPYKIGKSGGQFYLEAHAPLVDDEQQRQSAEQQQTLLLNTLLQQDALVHNGQVRLDWQIVQKILADAAGVPVWIAGTDNTLDTPSAPF